jgi:hypothetical protein
MVRAGLTLKLWPIEERRLTIPGMERADFRRCRGGAGGLGGGCMMEVHAPLL